MRTLYYFLKTHEYLHELHYGCIQITIKNIVLRVCSVSKQLLTLMMSDDPMYLFCICFPMT